MDPNSTTGRDREAREVTDYLEVWVGGARERVPLEAERITIGHSATNDVPLLFDKNVSGVHAVLERMASRWSVRDLSSRNGTFLNGERIWRERPLRPGDEIRVGGTRLVARLDGPDEREDATVGAGVGPHLTQREQEVLLALCRPVVTGEVFHEPASIHQMAAELAVTEAAVKQHLSRLYEEFGVFEREGRRARLANEAIRRGAVNTAEILARPPRDAGE
jgi:hypothetical protein